MNTPIIDPMVFYWIGVVCPIRHIVITTVITQIIALVFCLISAFVNHDMAESYGEEKYFKSRDSMIKVGKKIALTFFITIPFFVFVPSKETVMQMIVASKATPENLIATKTFVVDTIKEIKTALKEDNNE